MSLLTHETSPITERNIAVEDLRAVLTGQLIQPCDADYDQARQLWNGAIDMRPAVIVRCQNALDVAHAVLFARRHELPIAVRSGSHNAAGMASCNGGLVVDLSQMQAVAVDPQQRTARVEPGATTGIFAKAVEQHGLIAPTGTCISTGIGGVTLGGIGWLTGKHGLVIDNVRAFELVTADGQITHVDADSDADLFWGLRGGGGNFGIVTAFEYQLHPLNGILGGLVVYPMAQARQVLRGYFDITASAPDELVAYALLICLPEVGPVVALAACYSGEDHTGPARARAAAPARHTHRRYDPADAV